MMGPDRVHIPNQAPGLAKSPLPTFPNVPLTLRATGKAQYVEKLQHLSVAARPFPYSKQTAARAMTLLWLVGGFTILLVAVVPHPPGMRRDVMFAVGLTSPIVAAVINRFRDSLPRRVYPWLLTAGTGIITTLVAAGGGGTASVSLSFFYTWIAIYALVFFPPVTAAIQLLLAASAYATVLTLLGSFSSGSLTAVEPIVLGAVIATTCAVVLLLSKAREASEIDPLTGVANRRGLDRALAEAMDRATRHGDPLVVAMVDVDHFKQLNDQHGHNAGDAMLRDLVSRWTTQLRATDTLARFGGDEFVVVLPACTPSDAEIILERLRRSAPDRITCSLGSAEFRPEDSASMLITRADAALYDAKRLGRDQMAWST